MRAMWEFSFPRQTKARIICSTFSYSLVYTQLALNGFNIYFFLCDRGYDQILSIHSKSNAFVGGGGGKDFFMAHMMGFRKSCLSPPPTPSTLKKSTQVVFEFGKNTPHPLFLQKNALDTFQKYDKTPTHP